MRLKLFTVLNFVVRYQSICFACFIKKCFGRVILKTGVKPRFLMSPVLKSVFFINPVRVLWRQVRLFSKVSLSVESGFFSSPGFVRVRVRVRSGFRSVPIKTPALQVMLNKPEFSRSLFYRIFKNFHMLYKILRPFQRWQTRRWCKPITSRNSKLS